MPKLTLQSLAPILNPGAYIHIGNGERFHSALDEQALVTDCGLTLGPKVYHTVERPRLVSGQPSMHLGDICRRCAKLNPQLARVFGAAGIRNP